MHKAKKSIWKIVLVCFILAAIITSMVACNKNKDTEEGEKAIDATLTVTEVPAGTTVNDAYVNSIVGNVTFTNEKGESVTVTPADYSVSYATVNGNLEITISYDSLVKTIRIPVRSQQSGGDDPDPNPNPNPIENEEKSAMEDLADEIADIEDLNVAATVSGFFGYGDKEAEVAFNLYYNAGDDAAVICSFGEGENEVVLARYQNGAIAFGNADGIALPAADEEVETFLQGATAFIPAILENLSGLTDVLDTEEAAAYLQPLEQFGWFTVTDEGYSVRMITSEVLEFLGTATMKKQMPEEVTSVFEQILDIDETYFKGTLQNSGLGLSIDVAVDVETRTISASIVVFDEDLTMELSAQATFGGAAKEIAPIEATVIRDVQIAIPVVVNGTSVEVRATVHTDAIFGEEGDLVDVAVDCNDKKEAFKASFDGQNLLIDLQAICEALEIEADSTAFSIDLMDIAQQIAAMINGYVIPDEYEDIDYDDDGEPIEAEPYYISGYGIGGEDLSADMTEEEIKEALMIEVYVAETDKEIEMTPDDMELTLEEDVYGCYVIVYLPEYDLTSEPIYYFDKRFVPFEVMCSAEWTEETTVKDVQSRIFAFSDEGTPIALTVLDIVVGDDGYVYALVTAQGYEGEFLCEIAAQEQSDDLIDFDNIEPWTEDAIETLAPYYEMIKEFIGQYVDFDAVGAFIGEYGNKEAIQGLLAEYGNKEALMELAAPYIGQALPYVMQAMEIASPYIEQAMPYVEMAKEKLAEILPMEDIQGYIDMVDSKEDVKALIDAYVPVDEIKEFVLKYVDVDAFKALGAELVENYGDVETLKGIVGSLIEQYVPVEQIEALVEAYGNVDAIRELLDTYVPMKEMIAIAQQYVELYGNAEAIMNFINENVPVEEIEAIAAQIAENIPTEEILAYVGQYVDLEKVQAFVEAYCNEETAMAYAEKVMEFIDGVKAGEIDVEALIAQAYGMVEEKIAEVDTDAIKEKIEALIETVSDSIAFGQTDEGAYTITIDKGDTVLTIAVELGDLITVTVSDTESEIVSVGFNVNVSYATEIEDFVYADVSEDYTELLAVLMQIAQALNLPIVND